MDWTSKDIAAIGGARELMNREWAPCRHSCPVHADVPLYLRHAAEGNWQKATDVIRAHLPYACVCGRVCHHPCEQNCRRQDVDEPVAIREIKRFVVEIQGAKGAKVNKATRQDKARVAIIGSGPAGMTAALDLAKMGYRPTVFEKHAVAGGIPATAIPAYRLPRPILQADIDWICAHGVEVKTGVEIGAGKTVESLLADGFEAVLIATGLSNSRMLPMADVKSSRVHGVLDFLQKLSFGQRPDVGNDVLVIGGGNVAMDAARSAARLGARRVRAICLENEAEMPAWKWEQHEAQEEGISFIHRRGPVEIVMKNNAIAGLKARKVLSVFDENKRFNPKYDDSDMITVECDTIVFAIGQAPDYNFTKGGSLKLDERGRIAFNTATQQTSNPRVFAAGEIVTPPGSVVEACASGRRAATAITLFLSGKQIALDDTVQPKIDKIPAETAKDILKVPRVQVAMEDPARRKTCECEVDHNLEEPAALLEARRCMSCGTGAVVLADKCASCLTCLRVCPFKIPQVTDVARISSTMCQACGICVAECPANAIIWRGYDAGEVARRTKDSLAAVSAAKRKVVAYVGGFRATAADWLGRTGDKRPGFAEVYLPSTAMLGVADMLSALEAGADAVVVVSCADGTDRYPTVATRTRKRVEQVRQMLKDAGLGAERVLLYETADGGRQAVLAALADADTKLTANK